MAQQEAYTTYPLVDEAARRTSSVVRTISEHVDHCFQSVFACCFPLAGRKNRRTRIASQYDFDFDRWGGSPLMDGEVDENIGDEATALLGGDSTNSYVTRLMDPNALLQEGDRQSRNSKNTFSKFLSKLPFKAFSRPTTQKEHRKQGEDNNNNNNIGTNIYSIMQISEHPDWARTPSFSQSIGSTGDESMRSRGELVQGDFEDAGMLGEDRILQLVQMERVSSGEGSGLIRRDTDNNSRLTDDNRSITMRAISSPSRKSSASPRESSPVKTARTRNHSLTQRDGDE